MENVLEPNFKSTTISKNQNTNDIIKGIAKAINESKEASKILSEQFKSKNPVKSCEKVFKYLKDNLQYIREGENKQTSKTLPRLIYDKYGDCKHYTIFSYAILDALKIPVFMRLVSQKILNKEPTHIYTYALINGKEYIIDPVMQKFNEECKHNYKCDLTLNKAMSMTHLSGTDELATLGRRKRKSENKGLFKAGKKKLNSKQAELKNKFKETKKKHQQFLKKTGQKLKSNIKQFAHIRKDVAKKAFLKSIAVNYLNLADRIKEVYKTHPEDLKKFWGNYGTWQELTTAVNKGTKRGAILSGMGQDEGGGSDQAKQYEEGAKQSMGIIKQIIEFFKQRKAKKNEKQEQEDAEALKNMEASVMADPTIDKVDSQGNPITADTPKDEKGNPIEEEESGIMTPLLLGGAGLAVLYFVTKK
jgi:hypothetical protein